MGILQIFLNYRPELGSQLTELRAPNLSMDENLPTNPMYGGGFRICYYRKSEALPEAGDIEGQGQYWKTHYNTPLGKGTMTRYVYKVGQVLKAN